MRRIDLLRKVVPAILMLGYPLTMTAVGRRPLDIRRNRGRRRGRQALRAPPRESPVPAGSPLGMGCIARIRCRPLERGRKQGGLPLRERPCGSSAAAMPRRGPGSGEVAARRAGWGSAGVSDQCGEDRSLERAAKE